MCRSVLLRVYPQRRRQGRWGRKEYQEQDSAVSLEKVYIMFTFSVNHSAGENHMFTQGLL